MNKFDHFQSHQANYGSVQNLSTNVVQRKIGRHHLAFFRGVIQGLDIRHMADRYLETGMDIRRAKSTLTWIRDTLKQASLRHGRYREAHLFRIRVSPPLGEKRIPTLEEFREQFDPEQFYTEKELIQFYLEAYPQSVQARKRQRLINQQLEALKWIEPLISTDPVREDWVAAWFDETISKRLLLAKIATLGELMDRIAEIGYRWWIGVPRLDEKGAARIVAWLQGYEDSLGKIPEYSLIPSRKQSGTIFYRPPTTDIVPLESFRVPSDLDGRNGTNRIFGVARINATNDYEAILAWLDTKSTNTNTRRSYQKEAERILLWAILERGKALSSLTVEDCAAYRDWLTMVGRTEKEKWPFRIPQEAWLGEKRVERHKRKWKPFNGSLSATSVNYAISVVNSLFEWLVNVQYCAFNPWTGVSKTALGKANQDAPEIEFVRAFTVGQWKYLMSYLSSLPDTQRNARLKFVLPFAYMTGLRISELVDATVGRIYTMPLSDEVGCRWMLKVHGKGGKWRAVPLPSACIESLKEYLSYRGLNTEILENPPGTPLIADMTGKKRITTSALSKTLDEFFHEVSDRLRNEGKGTEAKAFERATTHWLRHTCGSHLARSGVPLNVIQRLLGHASLQTTSIYTDAADESVWQAVEGVLCDSRV